MISLSRFSCLGPSHQTHCSSQQVAAVGINEHRDAPVSAVRSRHRAITFPSGHRPTTVERASIESPCVRTPPDYSSPAENALTLIHHFSVLPFSRTSHQAPISVLFTEYTLVPAAKNVILSCSIILSMAASSPRAAICIASSQSDLTLAAGYKRCITKGSCLVAFCSN